MADPKDERSITYDTWTLPTVEGRRPMTVTLELRRVKDAGERSLSFEVDGMVHPYEGRKDFNVMGEVVKNPALTRAGKFLADGIAALVQEQIDAQGARPALDRLSTQHTEPWHEGKDQYYSTVSFNPDYDSGKLPGHTPVSDAKLLAMADNIKAGIDKLVPQAAQMIAQDEPLQPAMEPTKLQQTAFEQNVEGQWTAAVEGMTRQGWGRAKGDTRPIRRPPEPNDDTKP